MDQHLVQAYNKILQKELIPALGCTEPIAIALAAAKAIEVLGGDYSELEQVDVYCSGNIIKNVKGVVVPNSGGLRGIPQATAIGIVAGNAQKDLEVLDDVEEEDLLAAQDLIQKKIILVHLVEDEENLYLRTELRNQNDFASVEIQYDHTRINRIIRNEEVLLDNNIESVKDSVVDTSVLNLHDILDFADHAELEEETIASLEEEIHHNMEIAEEGIRGDYGAQVGKTIFETMQSDNVLRKSIAYAAAASDARMGGCSFPVVINSGSGNQGITVSISVILFAESIGASKEELLRALSVSNLLAIHQKRFIGKLSAFCGVVSASAAAAAGIAYLQGYRYDVIAMQVINTIATTGGIICDGAKSSCAGKIAAALQEAFLALEMAKRDRVYQEGEGIVGKNVEETIANVGFVAKLGMKQTDIEILKLMVQ